MQLTKLSGEIYDYYTWKSIAGIINNLAGDVDTSHDNWNSLKIHLMKFLFHSSPSNKIEFLFCVLL